jgi:hypothetical protein
MLCWHRLRLRGRLQTCAHCGVQIEECPCVNWRVPDGSCRCCGGSGWVAVVRGQLAKFREYADVEPIVDAW